MNRSSKDLKTPVRSSSKKHASWSDVAAVSETDDETSEFSTASSPTLSATTSSSSPSSSSTASPPSVKALPTNVEMNKWRYPRNKSFIVDMANPPSWDAQPSAPKVKTTKPENIYENVRSPSKETKPERTDSAIKTAPTTTPMPKKTDDTEIYFPVRSPLNPANKIDQKASGTGKLRKAIQRGREKWTLWVVTGVLILLIICFILLCVVLKNQDWIGHFDQKMTERLENINEELTDISKLVTQVEEDLNAHFEAIKGLINESTVEIKKIIVGKMLSSSDDMSNYIDDHNITKSVNV